MCCQNLNNLNLAEQFMFYLHLEHYLEIQLEEHCIVCKQ